MAIHREANPRPVLDALDVQRRSEAARALLQELDVPAQGLLFARSTRAISRGAVSE